MRFIVYIITVGPRFTAMLMEKRFVGDIDTRRSTEIEGQGSVFPDLLGSWELSLGRLDGAI